MKPTVALLLIVAVSAVHAGRNLPDDELYVLEEVCGEETGFDAKQVEKVRKRGVRNGKTATKWAKCMMQGLNVIKSDGTVNKDVKTIGFQVTELADKRCSEIVKKDIDHTARALFNCYKLHLRGVMALHEREATCY